MNHEDKISQEVAERDYRQSLIHVIHDATDEDKTPIHALHTAELENRVLEIARVAPVVVARRIFKLRDDAKHNEDRAGNSQFSPEKVAAFAARLRVRADRIEKLCGEKAVKLPSVSR
jgi:hypothetical protein